MNPIEDLQEKDSAEQSTETDKTAVCDGGRVETDTNTDSGDTGGDGGDEAGEDEDDGDGDSDDEDDDVSGCRRQATVNRTGDGQPLGAAVWLNADELAALGVNVNAANAVAYRVKDGDLHLDSVRGGVE